jgi:hypothetical protein
VLRRLMTSLAVMMASAVCIVLDSGAALAAELSGPDVETQAPLATGLLVVSVVSVTVLIAFAVVRNRRTLARRARRVFRRLARRLGRPQ